MSVPIFDVTRSQLLDWEQVGRLRGTSATKEGQWLVMEYGSRFGRPMRYVRLGEAFDDRSDAEGLIDFLDSLNFGGIIGHDYEIWHVIPEQSIANRKSIVCHACGVENYDVLRQLSAREDFVYLGCAYCGGKCGLDVHVCRGPIGFYCVCGSCYRLPELRHGMAVVR